MAAQQVERSDILHRELVRSQTLLSDYFPSDLAHHVKAAAQIIPMINGTTGRFLVLRDTGELLFKTFDGPYTVIPIPGRIASMHESHVGVLFITVDNKVIDGNFHQIHGFDGYDVTQVSGDYDANESTVYHALTISGKLLRLKILVGTVIEIKTEADVVQLHNGQFLDTTGKVFIIKSATSIILNYIKLPIIKILIDGFASLNGVHNSSGKLSYYVHPGQSFTQYKYWRDLKVFLDKSGYLYTETDEKIPNLTGITDYFIGDSVVITININNKVQMIKWVMKPVFTPPETIT